MNNNDSNPISKFKVVATKKSSSTNSFSCNFPIHGYLQNQLNQKFNSRSNFAKVLMHSFQLKIINNYMNNIPNSKCSLKNMKKITKDEPKTAIPNIKFHSTISQDSNQNLHFQYKLGNRNQGKALKTCKDASNSSKFTNRKFRAPSLVNLHSNISSLKQIPRLVFDHKNILKVF